MNDVNFNEIDLTLAIQLQAQFEEELRVQREKEEEKIKSLQVTGHKWRPKYKALSEPEQEKLSVSLVDPSWEMLDPSPSIFDLFLIFNHQFFWGRLLGVEVKWSPRMTRCAGICSYEGRGGLCSVRLSVPLLKLRPRKDLIETLLHEMIHAYLFVTHNNTDHDGHGPHFHEHMYRINKLSGTSISVYHSFHDEVAVYRQHVWRCDGPCRKRPPYFGLLKRSMNRAPSPRDPWWPQHAQTCGGAYTKIKEPEGYGVKKHKRKIEASPTKDIRDFFPVIASKKPKQSQNDSSNKETNHKTSQSTSNVKGKSSGSGGFSQFGAVTNGSSGSGLRPVEVDNSSNTNVHGFGKSIGGNGKKSGKSSGSTGMATASKSGKSSGSTRMATSGSTGSKTLVTKKPPGTTTRTTDEATVSRAPQFAAFSGSGHSLGGASSTSQPAKSRLVSEVTREKKMGAAEVEAPPTKDSFMVGGSLEDVTACPLCEAPLDSANFEEHIAECLGDFDDDFGESNSGSKEEADRHTSSTQLSDSVTIISDEEDYATLPRAFQSSTPTEETLPGRVSQSSKNVDILNAYPCPICDKRYSEGEINSHVNTHF